MSKRCQTPVSVDTTEADEKLALLSKQAAEIAIQATRTVRKVWESITLVGIMTGQAIDAAFAMMVEATLMTAQTIITIASAEAMTVVGAAKAAVSFGIAASMFASAINLSYRRSEARVQVMAAFQLANMWL